MDVLVTSLWLAIVAIVGLAFAKGVLLHMKRSARAERQRQREGSIINVMTDRAE